MSKKGEAYKNCSMESDIFWMPLSRSEFDLECGVICTELI